MKSGPSASSALVGSTSSHGSTSELRYSAPLCGWVLHSPFPNGLAPLAGSGGCSITASAGARPNVDIAAAAVAILKLRRMSSPDCRRANRRERTPGDSWDVGLFGESCRRNLLAGHSNEL